MNPIFSIIIPTYNRAYVLWRAIESVIAQRMSQWEIIVVDDGSTDCTLRLLEEFHDERIRAIRISNQGPSAARNRGLEVAHSPSVAYLDSDNTWHPDFLETMYKSIQQNSDAVLWYCGQNSTFRERSEEGKWALISERATPRKQYTLNEVWQLQGADTSCIVHRRSIIDKVGGWDEQCRWIEDWDIFLRVFLAFPDRVKWVPEILVEYRQVFGTGADGLCAEARENRHEEIRCRQYLLQKWNHHPDFAAADRLNKTTDDLSLMRARPVNG